MYDLVQWIDRHLVCPIDRLPLSRSGNWLISPKGRRYPVVDGIPVMLRDDVPPTAWWLEESLARARRIADGAEAIPALDWPVGEVHPHVQDIVDSTCGHLYRHSRQRLKDYPVPELRLRGDPDSIFLDIGCNWGRWCFAAARQGFIAVGIDPSLDGVLAARAIAKRLQLRCTFIVADARYLPFTSEAFDHAFSYSVLQHFSKFDAHKACTEAARVLRFGGTALVQLPNRFGIRSAWHLARRGFSEGQEFDVRYYRPQEIRELFVTIFGNAKLSVDGYFGLGIQPTDLRFFSPFGRLVVAASQFLRHLQRSVPALLFLADSIYVASSKQSA